MTKLDPQDATVAVARSRASETSANLFDKTNTLLEALSRQLENTRISRHLLLLTGQVDEAIAKAQLLVDEAEAASLNLRSTGDSPQKALDSLGDEKAQLESLLSTVSIGGDSELEGRMLRILSRIADLMHTIKSAMAEKADQRTAFITLKEATVKALEEIEQSITVTKKSELDEQSQMDKLTANEEGVGELKFKLEDGIQHLHLLDEADKSELATLNKRAESMAEMIRADMQKLQRRIAEAEEAKEQQRLLVEVLTAELGHLKKSLQELENSLVKEEDLETLRKLKASQLPTIEARLQSLLAQDPPNEEISAELALIQKKFDETEGLLLRKWEASVKQLQAAESIEASIDEFEKQLTTMHSSYNTPHSIEDAESDKKTLEMILDSLAKLRKKTDEIGPESARIGLAEKIKSLRERVDVGFHMLNIC